MTNNVEGEILTPPYLFGTIVYEADFNRFSNKYIVIKSIINTIVYDQRNKIWSFYCGDRDRLLFNATANEIISNNTFYFTEEEAEIKAKKLSEENIVISIRKKEIDIEKAIILLKKEGFIIYPDFT